MPAERVLVVGAGISGSIVAYWLGRSSAFSVTVIERSKSSQKQGQGLEIEEPVTTIIRTMGILDKFQAIRTSERGFELNDEKGRNLGRFEAGPYSPTGTLEMMRGDMTEVLYRAADESERVEYRFETTIQSLRQEGDTIIVDLLDRNTQITTTEEFDLVVGADGALSKTRHLSMGSPEQLKCFHPIGAYCAYYSIPRAPQDWPYSRLCHFPGRRVLWMRPTRDEADVTSCYSIHITDNNPMLHAAFLSRDRNTQKEALAEDFKDCGWEAPRVMRQMKESDNFYFDRLTQVKLPKWSKGRVVLTGDAAWSPTPFTGQGNHLAMLGAYVLAQELSRNPGPAAFEEYEKRLRSYVENSQQIPLRGYAPYLICPQTAWGIGVCRAILGIFSQMINFVKWTNLESLWPSQDQSKTPLDFDLQLEGSKQTVK